MSSTAKTPDPLGDALQAWNENIADAGRAAAQAKRSAADGRCDSAYYSVSAYNGFTGHAHGIADGLYLTGQIKRDRYLKMGDDITGIDDAKFAEKACKWTVPKKSRSSRSR